MSESDSGLHKRMLVSEKEVDEIKRLVQNPPVPWNGETAWTIHTTSDGRKILFESAFIDCPDCGSYAIWREGLLRCSECGQQRLIG